MTRPCTNCKKKKGEVDSENWYQFVSRRYAKSSPVCNGITNSRARKRNGPRVFPLSNLFS